jgi:hypothetical protein
LSKAFRHLPVRFCGDNLSFEADPGAYGCLRLAPLAQRFIEKNLRAKSANQIAILRNK